MQVSDNASQSRYELAVGEEVAFANYRIEGNVLHILHVEAPEALRGTGVAGQLMEGMLNLVREQGLKVRPVCGYAAIWIKRHKEYHDLLA